LKFRTLDSPVSYDIGHSQLELLGYLETGEVLVVPTRGTFIRQYLMGTVKQVTFMTNTTILILNIVTEYGALRGCFRHPGTLHLVSVEESNESGE
jgi:hypothetical protein